MTIQENNLNDDDVEGTSNEDEEKNFIISYVKDLESRSIERSEIRNKNQNVQNIRPSEASFSKLDSSLKKNTTFVKKLKNFSASQLDSLLKDMQGLNLTKYISEVAAALVEAKLKMTDVNAAVKLCCLLHQIYAEFSHHLFENWQKVLSVKMGEKIANASKLRVDLRLYAELVNVGLFNNKSAFSLLGNVLMCLVNMDKEEHVNISIILSFCKHCGDDYAGLISRKHRELAEKYSIEIPRSSFLPPEKQQNVRSLLKDYYNSLSKHLVKDHHEIQEFERQNRRILQTKGELNQERRDKLDTMRINYEKLYTTTQNFADVLDEDMPELTNVDSSGSKYLDGSENAGSGNVVGGGVYSGYGSLTGLGGSSTAIKDDMMASSSTSEMVSFGVESVWGDVDTKRFYCELPDLHVFLPSSYNLQQKHQQQQKPEQPQQTQEKSQQNQEKPQQTQEKQQQSQEKQQQSQEKSSGQESKQQQQQPEATTSGDPIVLDESRSAVDVADIDVDVEEELLDADADADVDLEIELEVGTDDKPLEEQLEDEPEDPTTTTVSNKIVLDAFLNNLSNCINREMIDNAAIDFLVTLNTKHNRRKLVRSLFGVNRTRLDLLPFYARFVAILAPALPEIANDLCQMLRQDFKYHVRKKDQINIESKVKVVRYIGELVKFNLYPKLDALFCVKVLLHDFSHHHIEMVCNLLEVCGRYLFCCPETHQRTRIYLEQMMRKKSVMALDSRYVTQIENAYYYVNPPESVALPRKQRPPIHQFIRRCLYQDLQKNNTDKILRLMRKLNWFNDELTAYAIKCLTSAHNVKYFNIRCLANLVAGLVAYQEEVGTRVVDGVLEDIRLGMEVNLPKYYQRRVAQIKYLGELYNYRMVESADVFKVLYSLITFGVTMSHEHPSPLDPPDNTFRIRLACVLLETSGTYFSSGSSKRRLDYYLVFLQAYYWFKRSDPVWQDNFPVSIDYLLRDTLTMLRPKLTPFENYEQAQKEIENIRKTLGIETTPLLAPSATTRPGNLDSIAETDTEMDEETSEEKLPVPTNSAVVAFEVDAAASTDDDEDEEIHRNSDDDDEEGEDDEEDENELEGNKGTSNMDVDEEEDEDDDDDDDEENENDDDDDENNNEEDVDDDINNSGLLVVDADSAGGDVLSHALPSGPKHISCSEDEEFVNALERMVSDNIQERMRENVKPTHVDIAVPMTVRSNKKTYEQLQETNNQGELKTMDFTLMIRKGNKQVYRNFKANIDSELAQNLRDQEMAQREEKQRVKRLTLNITERLEEEDYQEMLQQQQQRPSTQNLNRERKKYQHPKGAPDADLIFGPKRVR